MRWPETGKRPAKALANEVTALLKSEPAREIAILGRSPLPNLIRLYTNMPGYGIPESRHEDYLHVLSSLQALGVGFYLVTDGDDRWLLPFTQEKKHLGSPHPVTGNKLFLYHLEFP